MPDIPILNIALRPEFQPRRAPSLPSEKLEASEEACALVLQSALRDMVSQSSKYMNACLLYEIGSEQDRAARAQAGDGIAPRDTLWRGWIDLASEAAIMAAHAWDRAFAEARTSLNKIADWATRVDRKALKEAGTEFRRLFPDALKSRDAVAHPEARLGPKGSIGLSELKGQIPDIHVEGEGTAQINITHMSNGVLTQSFDGKLWRSPVSSSVGCQLVKISNMVMEAFTVLADHPNWENAASRLYDDFYFDAELSSWNDVHRINESDEDG